MEQSPKDPGHLSYDDLLKTLVAASDLDADQTAHLASCPHCRRQAEDLQQRYRRLGGMARELAPQSSRPFRVPTAERPKRLWRFKTATALAMMGAVIFIFTVWTPQIHDGPDAPPSTVALTNEEDARLMHEIDALVDDALPPALQYVAVTSEPILSKDLIDWIVPSIDEEDEITDPRA